MKGKDLLSVNRQAMDFFHKELLESPSGKQAMAYLKKRGVSREIIDTFCLGICPGRLGSFVKLFLEKEDIADLRLKSPD